MENSFPTGDQVSKKRSKTWVVVLCVILVLLVLLLGGGYWVYRTFTGSFKSLDLGVKYSQEDYTGLMEDMGVEIDPSLLCIDCPTPVFSNPNEVSISVSNEEASAVFEYINEYLSFGKVSGTQIRSRDGEVELVTNFEYEGKSFPIYMVGNISKVSENSITGDISTLKAGGIPVPGNIVSMVENGLLGVANEKLSSAGDTVRIDSVEITERGINFKGLIPTRVE